jgi:hypothetical protein
MYVLTVQGDFLRQKIEAATSQHLFLYESPVSNYRLPHYIIPMISRIVLRRVVHASSVSAVLRVSAPSPRWQVACRRLSGSAAALPQPAVDGDDAAQALLRLLQMADASSTPGSEGGREGPKAGDREPGTQGREGPAGDGAPVASNVSGIADR